MALLEATLASELENLAPTDNASAAVQAMADAYGVYFADAVCNGIAIMSVTAPTAAMASAMAFPVPGSPAGAGAVYQSGVVAFWAVIVAAPATYFTAAIGITPPPTLETLGAAMASTFTGNVGLSLADSAAAMACDLHAATIGGLGVFGGPASFTIV